MMSLIYIYLEECSGLPTGETIVATMGLIQEHIPSHNIDQFTHEDILRDTAWLSDCNWIYQQRKRFALSVNCIIVLVTSSSNEGDHQYVYISYPYQVMMMINVSIIYIHIK